MLKYQIKATYMTGNSFGSSIETFVLEEIWSDILIVKENLKRIKEHYNNYKNSCDGADSIILLFDNGDEWKFWPPWIGYFERLDEIEAVFYKDPELKISF